MITAVQLKPALSAVIARLRRMRLRELEPFALSGPEPLVAVEIDRDGTVGLMTPSDFAADPSRAVVLRPWRSTPAVLQAAVEDALEIVAGDEVRRVA